jgi:hypothetical protein
MRNYAHIFYLGNFAFCKENLLRVDIFSFFLKRSGKIHYRISGFR